LLGSRGNPVQYHIEDYKEDLRTLEDLGRI